MFGRDGIRRHIQTAGLTIREGCGCPRGEHTGRGERWNSNCYLHLEHRLHTISTRNSRGLVGDAHIVLPILRGVTINLRFRYCLLGNYEYYTLTIFLISIKLIIQLNSNIPDKKFTSSCRCNRQFFKYIKN